MEGRVKELKFGLKKDHGIKRYIVEMVTRLKFSSSGSSRSKLRNRLEQDLGINE
jgi:hypothetical protein